MKKEKPEAIKLYQLTGLYAQLCEDLEEGGGELTPELEKQLESTEAALSEKLENIGKLVKTLEADAEYWTARRNSFDTEAKRMKARADARLSRITSIKSYAAQCLQAADLLKMKTESFNFSLQPDHSVEATGEEIDPVFVRIKEELDKKAMIEHWKSLSEEERESHREFQGAKIVTKMGLRIR